MVAWLRWQVIVVDGEGAIWGLRLERLVDILVPLLVRVSWKLLKASLDVLLGGLVLLDLAWDHVDGQVGIHHVEVASLDVLKELISRVTSESVVILIFDVHNEFEVAGV